MINSFKQLKVDEVMDNVFVGQMVIKGGRSFNLDLLDEITDFFSFVFMRENNNNENRVFAITGEEGSGIFNVGGDLALFLKLVESRDSNLLFGYGERCIRLIDRSLNAKNHDMTTVSIINGNALGGGFESALSCDIIIAEKGYEISLPEIRLGFFPGMGAFELLSKRIGPQAAKKFILNGDNHTTDELYELGVFDYLVERGEGVEKLREVIKKERTAQTTYNSIRKIHDRQVPVHYNDMVHTLNFWVESILNISDRQKKFILSTIKRQQRRFNKDS